MSEKATRIGWIDEFKGFVLLLVCLFHVEQSFSCANMGMLHLSAMRMSAFFFISGMLFSTRRFPNFKDYLIHKTRVLLVPYILLSLLFLALDPVVYNFDLFPKAPRMTVMNIRPEIAGVWDYIYWNLAKIFVAGKSSIGSGPLWFVFTLYSVSLLFYGVQKAMTSKAITAVVAIISLAGGWLLYKNHIRLPLGIERDLTVLFFFACGWLSKEPIKKLSVDCFATRARNDVQGYTARELAHALDNRSCHGSKSNDVSSLRNSIILTTAAIVSFCAYAFIEIPDPNFSIMNNDLGKDFRIFVASSFFGITGLVATFILADKLPNVAPIRILKGILRNISRNALVILAVHWYILLVMRLLFRETFNRPGIAYASIAIVAAGVIAAIPLFRCKLYKLLGKQPASVRDALNIQE